MLLWVLIAALLVVFMAIGAIVTKEQIERQQRILRMKRFRRETAAKPRNLSREDKRTLV